MLFLVSGQTVKLPQRKPALWSERGASNHASHTMVAGNLENGSSSPQIMSSHGTASTLDRC
jgi:hypothetical protein